MVEIPRKTKERRWNMENKDNDLTKDDLLECSSLIHAKILELQCSLESLKVTLNKLEETHYKEDETLKNAKELYETVLEECEKYSKLYKKIVNLYLIER